MVTRSRCRTARSARSAAGDRTTGRCRRRCRRFHPRRTSAIGSQLMRHFLSVAVTHLPASMRTPSALMLLVSPPGFSLALPPPAPRARGPAVPSSSGVTEDAQQDAAPAGERLADNDVQRDHGPRRRRRRARLPRRPVRTSMGRTATSRSRGAIEGSELESPRPRYLASSGRCTAARMQDVRQAAARTLPLMFLQAAPRWAPLATSALPG
jgi:hypothetical protein